MLSFSLSLKSALIWRITSELYDRHRERFTARILYPMEGMGYFCVSLVENDGSGRVMMNINGTSLYVDPISRPERKVRPLRKRSYLERALDASVGIEAVVADIEAALGVKTPELPKRRTSSVLVIRMISKAMDRCALDAQPLVADTGLWEYGEAAWLADARRDAPPGSSPLDFWRLYRHEERPESGVFMDMRNACCRRYDNTDTWKSLMDLARDEQSMFNLAHSLIDATW